MRNRSRLLAVLAAVMLLAALTGCRPSTYVDGTYQAVSQADPKGYAWARVTIQGDKITGVEIKEITEKMIEKDLQTYPWEKTREAYTTLSAQFVSKNTWDVDTVAQATSSSRKYKEAVKLALEKAKRKAAVTTTYFNGTFLGKSEADGRGAYAVVWVTVENDKIKDVRLEEVIADGSFKDWATYSYEQAVPGREEMTARLIAATPATVANVDVVAEVTSSSNKWKAAVLNALASAKVK
jgi:uncharacterized protein with FMN-binding domain